MRGLIRAGMNVARINFSHGDFFAHARVIATLREVAAQEGRLVALLADLQGPKFRVGEIRGGTVELREGETVFLCPSPVQEEADRISVPHPELLRELRPGQTVLLDDGNLELTVEQTGEECVKCHVVTGGSLSSRKGINVLGHCGVASLTPKDREAVDFALAQGVDFFCPLVCAPP